VIFYPMMLTCGTVVAVSNL